MLLRNDLLHYPQPSPRTVRVLWIDPGHRHAYVYDVAARSAEVELVQLPALLADLRDGRASVLPADPYLMVVSQEMLPAKYLQLRARAWDIIASLVAQEPEIYDARRRGQMIARATVEHQVSHPTIYRYLRRYWQRGQTPNALLPDYCNSGGKGKVRQSSEGIKRGRPRKNGADDGPGVNADEDIRRIFRVAIARYAAGHDKFSRLGAYQQMLDEFFIERRIDPVSGRVHTAPQRRAAMLPTFGQFNYWLDHDDDRPPEVVRRSGSAVSTGAAFATALRAGTPAATPVPMSAATRATISAVTPVPISAATPATMSASISTAISAATPTSTSAASATSTSTSTSSSVATRAAGMVTAMASPASAWPSAPGRPGASYQLDAVRADVQLVSRADREQAIGRPCIYVVQDTYSRLITGVHVGLGPVSWPQAMLALANCGADKQRYSQQYGRRIEAGQWPARHLPDTLFVAAPLAALAGAEWGDGGALRNNFNLRCVASDHSPGDWQDVLARRFRLLAPDADAESESESGYDAAAGAEAVKRPPCRLDGVLDVAQFTRIVIDCILYYNHRQPAADAAIVAGSGPGSGPAAVAPAVLWDWGVEHRGGALKTYPEHLVRCSLLPVAAATVGADGIHFAGNLYTCARAVQERWYERARQRGGWQVKVAHDPSNLESIYLLDATAPMQFHACHLADASAAGVRRNLSAVEMAYLPRFTGTPVTAIADLRLDLPALVSFAG